MNAYAMASIGLGAIGVAVAAVGCLGIVALREPLARLHPATLASAIAPWFIGAAIALHEGVSGATAKALLTVGVLVIGSAALTYAAASATVRWRDRKARQ